MPQQDSVWKEFEDRSKSPYRIGLFVFLGLVGIFFALNAALFIPYALAILMGVMLTVLARPPYLLLRRKGLGPKLSALIVVAGILFLLIGPISFLITVAVKQAITLGQWLAEKDVFSVNFLVQKITKVGVVADWFGGPETIERQVRSGMQNAGRLLTGALLSTLRKFPNLVLQLFLALITCFFLLLDGKSFLGWLADRIPLPRDVQAKLSESFRDTSVSVVWSTLAAAATQSLLMLLAFLIIGVPGAFLAAGATFLFAWIPLIGSTPVWVAGMIFLYAQGSILRTCCMLAAGIITGVADNFVRPIVLKGRSNMHPLVSLIAIFGGIEIFGIFGVFLGPILAGVLTALLQIWPAVGHRFGILPDESAPSSKLSKPASSEEAA